MRPKLKASTKKPGPTGIKLLRQSRHARRANSNFCSTPSARSSKTVRPPRTSNLPSRVCWKNCAKILRANCGRGAVRRGLLWLALVDLRQAWPRPGLAALAIALAVLAIAFFARQIELRRAEVLAGYETAGAATFIVRIPGIADDQIDGLADSIRGLRNIGTVEAPYSGISARILADTSFVVFRNERQQEYLGARTSVLGVDANFDLARDYYVDFRDVNPAAPDTVLGIPLLGSAGV